MLSLCRLTYSDALSRHSDYVNCDYYCIYIKQVGKKITVLEIFYCVIQEIILTIVAEQCSVMFEICDRSVENLVIIIIRAHDVFTRLQRRQLLICCVNVRSFIQSTDQVSRLNRRIIAMVVDH